MRVDDDIRPMPAISPARPWSKSLPRRKPASGISGQLPKQPPAGGHEEADDKHRHIDEYA
jgi:hypothetical protein